MSTSTAVRVPRPPSEAQRRFAHDLGIMVTPDQAGWEVRKAITREIRRRGRAAMRAINPQLGDIFVHARHGSCKLTRISLETLKLTLEESDTSRKFVIDAMRLPEYYRVLSDVQLTEFLNSLPNLAEWLSAHNIRLKNEPDGRAQLDKDGWEKARHVASSQYT